jgi:hypothetical protein
LSSADPIPGSSNSLTDYYDMFVWNDLRYVRRSWLNAAPPLGKQLTTVGCSIAELTDENRRSVVDTPWPDRAATYLPSGSLVYVIRGFNHRCRIAIHDGPDWKIYSPIDIHTGSPLPCR